MRAHLCAVAVELRTRLSLHCTGSSIMKKVSYKAWNIQQDSNIPEKCTAPQLQLPLHWPPLADGDIFEQAGSKALT